MDLFSLANQTVLITGASSGIGHHVAGTLSRAGAKVVLAARRVDKLRDRVREIESDGGQAAAVAMDVSDSDSVGAGFAAAEEAFGPVDTLINNAGVESGVFTYATLSEADWDKVMDTNLKGLWLVAREFSRRFAAHRLNKGSIVNVGSILGRAHLKGSFAYSVSKAAVDHATRLMALESARFGIRVNNLAPGYFYTDVSKVLLDSEVANDFVKAIPQRRIGEFPDLDGPILLLASNASSYMTGSTLVVDGGHLCREL